MSTPNKNDVTGLIVDMEYVIERLSTFLELEREKNDLHALVHWFVCHLKDQTTKRKDIG